jgi:DNA-binding NtrC family response regulator
VAIDEIIRLKPDMVICEWYMPDATNSMTSHMNGTKLMKTVEQAGAGSKFIVLTHYESIDALRSFFPSGGIDYIPKPLDLESLQAAVRRYEARITRDAAEKQSERRQKRLYKAT